MRVTTWRGHWPRPFPLTISKYEDAAVNLGCRPAFFEASFLCQAERQRLIKGSSNWRRLAKPHTFHTLISAAIPNFIR